jgi:AcrR family transcriptional regulator
MSAPPATRQAYHHGDLRSALLEAGLRLLRERSVDDLGLRELAREVPRPRARPAAARPVSAPAA